MRIGKTFFDKSFLKALAIYLLNAEWHSLNLGNGAHLRPWVRRNHVLKGAESEVYWWDSVLFVQKVPPQILSTHAAGQQTWSSDTLKEVNMCAKDLWPFYHSGHTKIFSSNTSGKGMGGRKATISPILLLHSTYLEKNKTTELSSSMSFKKLASSYFYLPKTNT